MIVYLFLLDWHNTCLNTSWASTRCPQSDPLQVLIWVSQPYLNTPWTCKRCPQSDRLPVPIWLTQHLLEHPMNVQKMSSKWSSTSSYLTDTTSVWTPHGRPKWCPQRDRLPVPIWAVPTLFEHPMDVQQMSSKWSSTSFYLTDTTYLFGTPHGRPNDVLKGIFYKFLFERPNPIWTPHGRARRCPQSDRLPVPIWLTQHLLEHPMNVQKMSSKWSSISSF